MFDNPFFNKRKKLSNAKTLPLEDFCHCIVLWFKVSLSCVCFYNTVFALEL